MRLIPLLSLLLCCSRCIGAEAPITVWPLPSLPPGGNSAAVASPRVEWITEVMKKAEVVKKANAVHPVELIFDGDSITDYWRNGGREIWAARYEPLHAANFGNSSDKTEHLLWRLQAGQTAGLDPKLVVLLIGTNNLYSNNPMEIAGGVAAVVSEYEKLCPHAKILLLGVLPRSQLPADGMRPLVKAINAKIAALASDKRVIYLDIGGKFLAPDGTLPQTLMADFLHPTPAGYQVFADAIQPVIDTVFPGRSSSAAPVRGTPTPPTTSAPRPR